MASTKKTKVQQNTFNLDKYLLASGFIGPIIFFLSIYIIFPIIYPNFNPVTQTISELGGANSPIKTIVNVIGFSLIGILIMIFSIGIYRTKQINKIGNLSAIFFFLTGLFMYFVGVFPTDVSGTSTVRGLLHEWAANYQFPILAVAILLFAISAGFNQKLRLLTPILLSLGIVTLILAYFLFFLGYDPPFVGIIQRSAIGLPYFMVALIAFSLYNNLEK